MDIRRDEWLAGVLRREVYAVSPVGTTDDAAVIRAHAEGRHAMYFARVAPDRVDQVRALATAGFYVVDTNITLRRGQSGAIIDRGADIIVSDATERDHGAALDIAESAFRYSRFHLDPLLTKAEADRIKREWVRSYVEGRRGERLMVARQDGEVVGFNAVLASGRVRTIDLIAVRVDAQGRGVGSAMIAAFLSSYPDAERFEVGTQAANVRSLALYEHFGFRIARTQLVMHLHSMAT